MFVVHFLENRNTLLTQLRSNVPAIGDQLTIKGRRAQVTNVENMDGNHVHVQIELTKVNKSKTSSYPSKKKRK